MSLMLCAGSLLIAIIASLYFSTLTYALRNFSDARLADYLGRHNGDHWYESLTELTDQNILAAAVCRMAANLLIWVSAFALLAGQGEVPQYSETFVLAALVTVTVSIILPLALSKYLAEPVIGLSAPLLKVLRTLMTPLSWITRVFDNAMRRVLAVKDEVPEQEIEHEIMSAVEEGEKEGVVDEQERELIENVIEFRDATAGHIMTGRLDIVAMKAAAGLAEARSIIVASGHSRIPVYEQSLDKVIGILHARDLIKSLGQPGSPFDLRAIIRPAMFVPETKPLRNLLNDFRHQKVQLAIVQDEYGATSGLVTIEDVLEELVGEMADEHEPSEPAMFRQLPDGAAEADARLPVSELNRLMSLQIPEDAGYETIAGFLMNGMGRIPEKGAVHDFETVRFTVLDAEPSKIKRVRIEPISNAQPGRAVSTRALP
jgi:putative hemolysin